MSIASILVLNGLLQDCDILCKCGLCIKDHQKHCSACMWKNFEYLVGPLKLLHMCNITQLNTDGTMRTFST